MIVPLLESTRLRLRQYRADDFRHIAALNSDSEVRKHVGGVLSEQRVSQYLDDFIAARDPTDLRSWAVEDSGTGKYIGHAWLLHQGKPYQPDVGILISKDCWGNRFGSEVMTAIQRFARRELGCTCVYASVDTDNMKSISMLRHAGFRYLATEKDEEGNFYIFVNNEA
jgi:RimJ/RimL family protein N-acetyltransferase